METWYPVPPYRRTEAWKILNQNGELVAEFQERADCEMTAKLHNDFATHDRVANQIANHIETQK